MRRCPSPPRSRTPMLYALTIFASAFLLFLLQPIVAKQILPWFGGSASVWTTCLVFFQTTLLLGYGYADFSVRRLAPRAQALLHIVLLVASLAVLPIIPGAFWKPTGAGKPDLANPGASRGNDWTSVFRAFHDQPSHPGMVRAPPPRPQPVSAVRAVQPRVDAGAARLPIPARALDRHADAGLGLVRRLCRLHRAVRARGLPERHAYRPARVVVRRPERSPRTTASVRRSRASCCGARWRRPVPRCCWRSPATSRRTSRPFLCSGSCRCRST